MSCSIPFIDKLLHKLGYEPACIVHDIDYGEAESYNHKLKSGIQLAKNMIAFVPKWYSYPIGFTSFVVLTMNPVSYYLYFKNKHNLMGHVLSASWLGITVCQVVYYL